MGYAASFGRRVSAGPEHARAAQLLALVLVLVGACDAGTPKAQLPKACESPIGSGRT